MPSPPEHIECAGVTKWFGATRALDGVDLTIRAGTIHAIVGENGAGKSTIGKVLAGAVAPDEGRIVLRGEPVRFASPVEALDAGITMVAQELSLVPARSVIDNVFLGREWRRGPFVDRAGHRRRFDRLVADYGIDAPPDALVGRLPVSVQQKVEILRALSRSAEVIVMDEPTARLTSEEAVELRRTVRLLADQGVTVVYISHFLDEVLAIADTITIMRDGAVVRTGPAEDETHTSLIEGIVGRTLDAAFPPRQLPPADAPAVLEVDDLARDGAFDGVSLRVRAGEIVVLAGLVGSGRTEVLRAIFGADRATGGSMTLAGAAFAPRSPRHAIGRGVAMVPESRRDQGLLPRRSVAENISLAHLDRFVATGGRVRAGDERAGAQRVSEQVGLTGATIASTMDELSGGNQQKSLFARWLIEAPTLLLADEPTRGVDVGAKRGIYDLLTELAGRGVAVLMACSELDEVLGLAHRILVMNQGRLVGELAGSEATESDVMALAFGVSAP